jgi:hypothetical protein
MAITANSKVKEIIGNPVALELVKKYVPTIDDPKGKMAWGMSLKALMGFPQAGISKETAEEVTAALEAANIE